MRQAGRSLGAGRGPRRGWILTRVAVRAAIVAAIVLVAGALAARASIDASQMQATRLLAATQAQNIIDETESNVRLGGDFGSLPYELVGSDGQVISSSAALKGLESRGPVMPIPDEGAEQIIDKPYVVPAAARASAALDGTTLATSVTLSASAVSMNGLSDRPGELTPDGTYRVYVFVTPSSARLAVASLDRYLWPGVLVAVLLVAGAAASAVRSSLRTVEAIRAQAAAVEESIDGGAIEVVTRDRELGELASTLNAMVGRLRAARETQRRFATDAAHELRSPIGSLVVALEIADRYPDEIDVRESLRHALTEARHVQQLAVDLLSSAGPEASPSTVVPTSVESLVQDAARTMQTDLELRCSIDPAVVAVAPQRVIRAMANVLRNAERHARTRIDVSGERAGACYHLRISNDGSQVPEWELDRIFEPFARLDEARTRDTGGAGLGLAIARRDVEASGGSLRATADVERTAFEFVLPIDDGEPA